MAKWNSQIEEELTILIKDWLKQKGKTQKDLRKILNASSDRMPTLIEVLKKEYFAPRPASERLVNKKLQLRNLDIMRDWETCLEEYLNNSFKNFL